MTRRYSTALDEVTAKLGLPTPFPSRWEELDDNTVGRFVEAIPRLIRCVDKRDSAIHNYIASLNEHLKTRHGKWLDLILTNYPKIEEPLAKSQYYFTIEKVAGSSKKRVAEVYELFCAEWRNLDRGYEDDTFGDPRQWDQLLKNIKHNFYYFFTVNGNQQQWDGIVSTIADHSDYDQLLLLRDKKQKRLDKNGVDPVLPPRGKLHLDDVAMAPPESIGGEENGQ